MLVRSTPSITRRCRAQRRHIIVQLHTIIERAQACYRATGLVPDLYGLSGASTHELARLRAPYMAPVHLWNFLITRTLLHSHNLLLTTDHRVVLVDYDLVMLHQPHLLRRFYVAVRVVLFWRDRADRPAARTSTVYPDSMSHLESVPDTSPAAMGLQVAIAPLPDATLSARRARFRWRPTVGTRWSSRAFPAQADSSQKERSGTSVLRSGVIILPDSCRVSARCSPHRTAPLRINRCLHTPADT